MHAPLRFTALVPPNVQRREWRLVVPLVRVPVLLDDLGIANALHVRKLRNLGLRHVRAHEVHDRNHRERLVRGRGQLRTAAQGKQARCQSTENTRARTVLMSTIRVLSLLDNTLWSVGRFCIPSRGKNFHKMSSFCLL